ncbi:MAG: CopG family transcriptional regulator [Planctomycetota bacterium]
MERRRATIYLDADLHRALKLKAAGSDRSVSDIVAEAVKRELAEDAVDLQALEERAGEPDLSFADVVKEMRRNGRI